MTRLTKKEVTCLVSEDVGLNEPLLRDGVPMMGLATTISDLGIGRKLEGRGKDHRSFKG
jgi:hypothetical protein